MCASVSSPARVLLPEAKTASAKEMANSEQQDVLTTPSVSDLCACGDSLVALVYKRREVEKQVCRVAESTVRFLHVGL